MQYKRFEEIPVWQAGIDMTVKVFKVTSSPVFRYKGDIANQIQRAALSVPNNIAEGFERGSTQELINFLYYSRGSAGEVRSICHVITRIEDFADHKLQITEIMSLAESISRQLGGWLKSLRETEMPGQKKFTDKERQIQEQRRSAEAFVKQMRRESKQNLDEIIRKRRQDSDL